jgi:phosphopantetheine--protein transferase-like protein
MIDENQLRELLAPMLTVPATKIGRDTSLASLDSSLGETRLRLGLKRCGATLPAGSRPLTFGALCDVLQGKPGAGAGFVPAGLPRAGDDLRIGLDLQEISALPPSSDYWKDEFYRGVFGKTEIAYAVLQSEPRRHFAGFWCAKEALRKCDPEFANAPLPSTMVAHDGSGRPHMIWHNAGQEIRLPHAVSISHTGNLAMAVVALPAR